MKINMTPELSRRLGIIRKNLTIEEKLEYAKAQRSKKTNGQIYLYKKYLQRNPDKVKKRPKTEGI
tara:strand:+ start:498 stop:692 length:195 start_codon:yes stop_codon:yes gene_type:complete